MKNLAYCVSLVQLDLQDFSPRNYNRFLQYAINTYKEEIGMGISPDVEVLYADIETPLGTVDMPIDYEYYTMVAIMVGGRLITLTRNDNMALNRRYDSCGDEIGDSIDAASTYFNQAYMNGYGYPFAGHYRAGNFVGELYGLGGGINPAGYFTEDWKMRRFQFTNVPMTSVVIEYVSNGAGAGTLIDDLAIPVIRYGIHDQLSLFDNKENQANKSRMQGRFQQAVLDYRVAKTTPTLQDYLDNQYRSYKSSPKR